MFSHQHPCGAFGCHHAGRSQLTEEEGSGRSAALLLLVSCLLVCFFRMFYKMECLQQWFQHVNVFFTMNVVILKKCFSWQKYDWRARLCSFNHVIHLKFKVNFYFFLTMHFLSCIYIQLYKQLQCGLCIKMHNNFRFRWFLWVFYVEPVCINKMTES